MAVSAEAVMFDDDRIWVDLSDGRRLGVPLAWFPRLLKASPEDPDAVAISAYCLHWEALDDDSSRARPRVRPGGDGTAASAATA